MIYDYISVNDVHIVRVDQVNRYGGVLGVRDPGLWQATLPNTETGYHPTPIDETTPLWESISRNPAFIDRSKKVLLRLLWSRY